MSTEGQIEDNYNHPDQRWKRRGGTGANQKAIYILEQRSKGRLFKDIAADLGINELYACSLYNKLMKRQVPEKVEQIRKLQDRQLEYLLSKLSASLEQGHYLFNNGCVVTVPLYHEGNPVMDEEGNHVRVPVQDPSALTGTIASMLKVMERRSKLWGLDAPTKTALTDPTGEKEATPLTALSVDQLLEEATRRGLPTKIFEE